MDYCCNICGLKLRKNSVSIQCMGCGGYVHLKSCAGFRSVKDGEAAAGQYMCTPCSASNSESGDSSSTNQLLSVDISPMQNRVSEFY